MREVDDSTVENVKGLIRKDVVTNDHEENQLRAPQKFMLGKGGLMYKWVSFLTFRVLIATLVAVFLFAACDEPVKIAQTFNFQNSSAEKLKFRSIIMIKIFPIIATIIELMLTRKNDYSSVWNAKTSVPMVKNGALS